MEPHEPLPGGRRAGSGRGVRSVGWAVRPVGGPPQARPVFPSTRETDKQRERVSSGLGEALESFPGAQKWSVIFLSPLF